MLLDDERAYRAVAARDARFDGWFFTAVLTTRPDDLDSRIMGSGRVTQPPAPPDPPV